MTQRRCKLLSSEYVISAGYRFAKDPAPFVARRVTRGWMKLCRTKDRTGRKISAINMEQIKTAPHSRETLKRGPEGTNAVMIVISISEREVVWSVVKWASC